MPVILKRRDLLHGAAAMAFTGCDGPAIISSGQEGSFEHGVASGDPLPDSVLLWTRLTPNTAGVYRVDWEMALDPEFSRVVVAGRELTESTRDYTLKVEATGLEPATTYYYRFSVGTTHSPTGRTRTAPVGQLERLRFAAVSCSNYAQGYFSAYRRISERADLDFVLHLGDYIYENGTDEYGDVRAPDPPHETITLSDYRRRYAQHREDPDLQEVHRQHPFIAIWDDHEVANNSWMNGAQNHDPETEGSYEERKAAALQAYYEWMPIRDTADRRGYRCFSYGSLADLMVLETRLDARDGPATDEETLTAESRRLLGAEQLAWLFEGLDSSRATWRLIGNQVLMGQLVVLKLLDSWDGFPAERRRLLEHLKAEELDNVVVLSGDIHSSFALELPLDPLDSASYDPESGTGALAVEFTTPAVTSPGLPAELVGVAQDRLNDVKHIKYSELTKRGYLLVDVTEQRLEAEYFYLERVDEPDEPAVFAAAFAVQAGKSHIVPVDGPSKARRDSAPLAPPPPPAAV